jgi:hypothetical protein
MVSSALNTTSNGFNWALIDGDWYWYNLAVMGNYYLRPVNQTEITATTTSPYKAAPYMCGVSGGGPTVGILFNEDEKRFEYQAINRDLGSMNNLKTKPCDPTTWQKSKYDLIYMDYRVSQVNSPTGNIGYAIVKNLNENKNELLLFNIENPPYLAGTYTIPSDINVEAIQFFALHGSSNYMFYVTGDKLYRWYIPTSDTGSAVDVTSAVLPAGHRFSKLKNSEIRFTRKNMIAVCTYDPSGEAGKNGRLAFYDVGSTNGELTLGKHPENPTDNGYQIDMEWSGFGKIINVDYKIQPQ